MVWRSLAVALLLAASACSGKHSASGKVEISYWEKWTGFEGEAMQAVVNDFNRSQDRIHVTMLTISEVERKLLVATAGGNPPDVAGLWSWITNVYADRGAIIPLDDYCTSYGIGPEQYIPIYWQLCRYRGHVFALPATPGNVALHWNKRLFREVGLDPDRPPRTIEELDQYAEKLTKRDKTGRIAQAGFIHSEPGWWHWSWGFFFGGQLWDGDRRITVFSPENIRAFRWIQSYPQKYGAGQLQGFRSGFQDMFATPQNLFLSGQLAMEVQGVWMFNFINKFAPGMEWGAAPFPYPSDRPDLACTTLNECDTLVIPKDARHPNEAFQFIAFVQSRRAMEKLCMAQGKHTPLRQVSDEFWAKHPHPYVRLFYDLAYSPNSRSTAKLGFWNQFHDDMNSGFDAVWTCQKTPEEMLRGIQERTQKRLDREIRTMTRRKLWQDIVEGEIAMRAEQKNWRIPERTLRPALGPAADLINTLFPGYTERR